MIRLQQWDLVVELSLSLLLIVIGQLLETLPLRGESGFNEWMIPKGNDFGSVSNWVKNHWCLLWT